MSNLDSSLVIEAVGTGRARAVVVSLPDGTKLPLGRGDLAEPKARSKIANVFVEQFPQIKLDDVLAKLDALAIRSLEGGRENATSGGSEADYFLRDGCTYWRKRTSDSPTDVLLANFTARIESENFLDDGVEVAIEFSIHAVVAGVERHEAVPAGEFKELNWVSEQLGANAIVEPGIGLRERMRAAIQHGDGSPVPGKTVYTHTGWRELEAGRWVYLHGGGPLGPVGPVPRVGVRLPQSLSPFVLPEPPTGVALASACAGALAMPRTLPKSLGFALLCTAIRAALGGTDFSVFLVGSTGAFKSELAALVQSFFGKEFDRERLPASWNSTSNYLEQLAFTAKDAVLVVDDFAPSGSKADVQRFHREADRLLRAQGNQSGRGRLTSESTPMEAKPPRGLILVTGEDLPPGESLRARCLIIEVNKGEISSEQLSACQEHAQSGSYAMVMAAFVQHAAADYPGMQSRLEARSLELRKQARSHQGHLRTAAAIAELQAGFDEFVKFAHLIEGHGVLQVPDTLEDECWQALMELASAQSSQQSSVQPVQLFLDLLLQAIAAGHAHIEDISGGAPLTHDALGLGWEQRALGHGEQANLIPKGKRVGWVDEGDLYLLPDVSLAAAQSVADESGRIPISTARLGKHLHEQGLLRSTGEGNARYTVRRTISGARPRVIHMSLGTLLGPGQPGQPGRPGHSEGGQHPERHAPVVPGSAGAPAPDVPVPSTEAEGEVHP